ncbi:double-strand break repair helicase AddA [uncultured Tateyamaria sp.]|uniref:double-strand break repair helicase AddA n=1 Tax=Tateyamaria sp. 1078 TaxID=3417464 RepID=UPI002612BD6C|nr:double-strand break repair helicase AddA [uncultured Tateyamaria sp.]
MTPLDEASRRQHDAAEPKHSTWLSANAGSGKTRVLTDRVARLLLGGVQPQHILCLTYTKAAASEMQNRLFKRLGEWAMLDDDALRAALQALGYTGATADDDLRRARTLFARAIETPGGLKIQTIHSFCAALLRRFPLEAGVSPQFTEIEDRAAELLRGELLDQMAEGPDAALLTSFAQIYSGDEIVKITGQIVSNTGQFGLKTLGEAMQVFGLPADMTPDTLVAETFGPGDAALIQGLIPLLAAGSAADQKAAQRLAMITALDIGAIPALAPVFTFGSGQKAGQAKTGSFPTKATQVIAAHLMPDLDALMQRIADAREAHLALVAAQHAFELHRFAARFADAYADAKQSRAWLDFDDLILKARQLLSDPNVAAWVLYRLDGGIDHILVDEAQDTSPTQWDVIRKLAEEFSSGTGARDGVERTIFVVGDKKQSIYSFQGADPEEFDRMQDEFGSKLADSGQKLHPLTLDYSFRSSPAILRLVDMVFEQDADAGFPADGRHIAFHTDMPGRVDLWPVVPKPESETERDWYDPVDRRGPENEKKVLAHSIAREIKRMLDDRTPIPDGDMVRAVEPRDFLILVQRRGGIFGDLIRACKELELPIAGADRLKVGAELAVRDLGALLSFLATPEDSLSLATALRSPLFGWTEQALFTLAHHRDTEFLWQALRTDAAHTDTVAVLQDMRSQIDFLRPYDLIERMLTRHRGRQNLLARLGTEAEDGIDALLSQALAYERASIPSLTGFLTWMETDDLEIKRQIDSASNQIRVMTVHGAKGLEAPIVILPECGKRTVRINDPLIQIGATPVWRMPDGQRPEAMRNRLDAMRTAQEAEALRLLYVALTRAEKWLIVAASGELSKAGGDWWQRVETGMQSGGAVTLETPMGQGLRLSHGTWPEVKAPQRHDQSAAPVTLPDLFARPAPAPVKALEPLSPSDLGGAKALPGDGRDAETATAYGTLVHALLEELPRVSQAAQVAVADRICAGTVLPETEVADARAEALTVLNTPDLGPVFHPETLAEVPFVAQLGDHVLRGTIDRLIVGPDSIEIIDFKSNRVVPSGPVHVPDGLLRQMGAYVHAIAQIYPDRRITCAILWTHTATLMPLPHDIVTQTLRDTPYLDAS